MEKKPPAPKKPRAKKVKKTEVISPPKTVDSIVPVKKPPKFTANDVISIARETLGTPFRHQGRLCGMALDCAGVAAYVATKLGVPFYEWPGYGRTPSNGLLETVMMKQPCLVKVYEKKQGDIFLMKFSKEPQHVAIYTGTTIIHSYEQIGRVVEHGLDDEWEKRITHIFRFKELAS